MAEVKDYQTVISLLIEEKYSAFGQLAIDKANGVVGLQVDKSGQIFSITGDSKMLLQQLLALYERIDGQRTATFLTHVNVA